MKPSPSISDAVNAFLSTLSSFSDRSEAIRCASRQYTASMRNETRELHVTRTNVTIRLIQHEEEFVQ